MPKSDSESHYSSGFGAGDGDTERKIQRKCFHGNPTGNVNTNLFCTTVGNAPGVYPEMIRTDRKT